MDPLADGEWWLASVGATSVAAPGPGVPVAVIDTGVDFTHPEFVARPDTRSLNAQSTVDTLGDYHGTAVASIVGAPSNGVGMVGVYPQASIYSYDADLSGAITNTDLIQGVAAAARLKRAVINLSVGSTRRDPLLEDTVLSAVRNGALVVAASGNFGANSAPTYPADLPHVLTVGATDHTGLAATFSSASDSVDLTAPGVGISVAVPYLYTVDGYQFLDGTSFSAPIVSGAAALVWTVRSDLDSGQVFDLLRSSATDISPRGFDPETGFGMLDIPARARGSGAEPRLARAERRRPAGEAGRPLPVRLRAAHDAGAHECVRARLRRRDRGSGRRVPRVGAGASRAGRAGEQLGGAAPPLAAGHADA